MSVKNLFNAFHDFLSMRAGDLVDPFLNDADWAITERSIAPNALVEERYLQLALENCGGGERYLVKSLYECASNICWHERSLGSVKYNYAEIIGPVGHFPRSDISAGIYFVEPNTTLPNHWVVSEELLIQLTNGSEFSIDESKFSPLKSGSILFHESNERHALKTGSLPLLALYAWRDGNLQQQPEF